MSYDGDEGDDYYGYSDDGGSIYSSDDDCDGFGEVSTDYDGAVDRRGWGRHGNDAGGRIDDHKEEVTGYDDDDDALEESENGSSVAVPGWEDSNHKAIGPPAVPTFSPVPPPYNKKTVIYQEDRITGDYSRMTVTDKTSAQGGGEYQRYKTFTDGNKFTGESSTRQDRQKLTYEPAPTASPRPALSIGRSAWASSAYKISS